MAKKKAAQPAKSTAKSKAPAKGEKTEKVWDSSKGYTGTQSDYKPPDTDPAKQTVNEGRDEQDQ